MGPASAGRLAQDATLRTPTTARLISVSLTVAGNSTVRTIEPGTVAWVHVALDPLLLPSVHAGSLTVAAIRSVTARSELE